MRLNVYCEMFRVAWYDMELSSYQAERQDGELAKVFEERAQQEKDIILDHLRPKSAKEEQPEWTQMAKSKKGDDYYSKLREVSEANSKSSFVVNTVLILFTLSRYRAPHVCDVEFSPIPQTSERMKTLHEDSA